MNWQATYANMHQVVRKKILRLKKKLKTHFPQSRYSAQKELRVELKYTER